MSAQIPLKLLKDFFEDEIIAMNIYEFLKKKSREKKDIFEKFAEMEKGHSEFWKDLTEKTYGIKLKVGMKLRLKILWNKFIALITPLTFMINYLELGERSAYIVYSKLLELVKNDEELYQSVKKIVYDEIEHEGVFMNMLIGEKSRLAKIKDAIYGMTDSLVEILALVIGLVSVIASPLTIGLAGLISAVGGTFSMTSGAYLSSKSQNDLYEGAVEEIKIKEMLARNLLEENLKSALIEKGLSDESAKLLIDAVKEKPEILGILVRSIAMEETPTNPKEVASTTGIYYVLGALPAIVPFFIAAPLGLTSIIAAMIAVLLSSIVSFLTGIFTGVLSGIDIKRKALENVIIILGATAATYLIGTAAKIFLGIEI